MSTLDHKLEPEVTTVRRLEVITGTRRRRQFTEDSKACVVEETLAAGAVVSEIARRHASRDSRCSHGAGERARRHCSPPRARHRRPCRQLWKRALPSRPARKRQRQRTHVVDRTSGSIEVLIRGVTVRIGYGADAKTIAAVLRALAGA